MLKPVRPAAAQPKPAKQAATPPAPSPLDRMTLKDREFLPAALEILETPPSPASVALLWFFCVLTAATLLWSYLSKVDIYAIAPGKIQPIGRSKIVQPVDMGKVVRFSVRNGQQVSAGDILVELDPTDTSADRDALERDRDAATAEIARRRLAIAQALSGDFKPVPLDLPASIDVIIRQREQNVLASELAYLSRTQETLRAQLKEKQATYQRLIDTITAREKLIKLGRERADMRELLQDRGAGSRALVIEALQALETQIVTLIGEKGQIEETTANIAATARKLDEIAAQYISDQNTKLADAERKLDRSLQDLVKARSRSERTKLVAPISGIVQQLEITTIGQVVTSGQPVMTIVPQDGEIEVEAMVLNSDIGFVQPGQEVVVKVETFPFTRYGTISGRVQSVSRDGVSEAEANPSNDAPTSARNTANRSGAPQRLVFPAVIRLEASNIMVDGKSIPLSPGMAVVAEIKTGQRRAIDFLLSPLRESVARIGTER